MDPSLVMSTNFLVRNLNGLWLGDFQGFFVENCDGEVPGRLYIFLVVWSSKVYLSVHHTGPLLGDVLILVFWWAWWTAGCFQELKLRLHAHFYQDACAEG